MSGYYYYHLISADDTKYLRARLVNKDSVSQDLLSQVACYHYFQTKDEALLFHNLLKYRFWKYAIGDYFLKDPKLIRIIKNSSLRSLSEYIWKNREKLFQNYFPDRWMIRYIVSVVSNCSFAENEIDYKISKLLEK